eukprot:scaffold283110_cov19-Prasinocladus_malaysianus.AAC.1
MQWNNCSILNPYNAATRHAICSNLYWSHGGRKEPRAEWEDCANLRNAVDVVPVECVTFGACRNSLVPLLRSQHPILPANET